MGGQSPHISVVIPTRNRPDDVYRCLTSLALVEYPSWDVTVVDQSSNRDTADVVAGFVRSLPITYVAASDRGQSRGRNLGMRATFGEIIAYLDDDCTVEPSWLASVAAVWRRYPNAAVVFGSVEPSAVGDVTSFTPAYAPVSEAAIVGVNGYGLVGGMGASMYIRRGAAVTIGPFDPFLDPGSDFFGGAGDNDYAYRALRCGLTVIETPEINVRHHGARTFASGAGSRLYRTYRLSAGGLHMKMLRCGDIAAYHLAAEFLRRALLALDVWALFTKTKPSHLGSLGFYVCGVIISFRLSVNRKHGIYSSRRW